MTKVAIYARYGLVRLIRSGMDDLLRRTRKDAHGLLRSQRSRGLIVYNRPL